MAIVFPNSNNKDSLLHEVNGLLDKDNMSAHFLDEIKYTNIVESSLPKKAVQGERIIFKAAEGIYWELVYTGEPTAPWAKIGGPPLVVWNQTILGTTSETPVFNSGLAITLPLTMVCEFEFGSSRALSSPTGLARVTLYEKSTDLLDLYFASNAQGSLAGSGLGFRPKGTEFSTRYCRLSGTGEVQFVGLFLKIDPWRVG